MIAASTAARVLARSATLSERATLYTTEIARSDRSWS
jgi:hypothetical protein